MARRNNGKDLGEALLRGASPKLAGEYDDEGIPKDLKPTKILTFLNKLDAYNMSQPAGKDKLLMLVLIGPEGKGFMKTFDAIRLVPKDTEDAASEMGPLRLYGALNPERPADDRKKCFEWDARASKEWRNEFRRASDRSTHDDALAEQWCDSKPTKEGPAVDMASWYMRREVVTKNAVRMRRRMAWRTCQRRTTRGSLTGCRKAQWADGLPGEQRCPRTQSGCKRLWLLACRLGTSSASRYHWDNLGGC